MRSVSIPVTILNVAADKAFGSIRCTDACRDGSSSFVITEAVECGARSRAVRSQSAPLSRNGIIAVDTLNLLDYVYGRDLPV